MNDPIVTLERLSLAVRENAPIIHNITNNVVQNDTADAIAAVGGTQATLHNLEEAADVAAMAGALAVNPGTLDEDWLSAAQAAVKTASDRATPWVLDPVAVGFTAYRTRAARALLDRHPTVLKANASEILSLAGAAAGGHAADSMHGVDQAADAALGLAQSHRCVVVVTGAADLVTDGRRTVRVRNGAPLMGHMIGSGCMLTAVVGCYLAVADDPFEAAWAACAHFAIAGQRAAAQAGGPGTLKPLLIDALYHFGPSSAAPRPDIEFMPPA